MKNSRNIFLLMMIFCYQGCASHNYNQPKQSPNHVIDTFKEAIELDTKVQDLVNTFNRYPDDLEVAQAIFLKAKGIQSGTIYNSLEDFNREYAEVAANKIERINSGRISSTELKTIQDSSSKLFLESVKVLGPHLEMNNEHALYENAVMLLMIFDKLTEAYSAALKEEKSSFNVRIAVVHFLQRSAARGYQPARKLLIALGESVPAVKNVSLYDKIVELEQGQRVLLQVAKARVDYELSSISRESKTQVNHIFIPPVSQQPKPANCTSSCFGSPLGLSIDCNSYCH